MASLDAVSIEHTLARFFGSQEIGERGTFYDADVFRAGNPKELAEVLRRVGEGLNQRVAKIRFSAADEANGGAKALIDAAISRLSRLAEAVERQTQSEREDYHWEVFGVLMMAIVGLLERLES